MKTFILLIGLILILEGLPYAAAPESMQGWLRKLGELPAEKLRMMGFVAMLAGFLICFIVQRTGAFA